MNFGQALEHLKQGDAIQRKGWNGKNMCIYLNKGSVDAASLGIEEGTIIPHDHPTTIDGVSISLFDCGDKGTITRLPNINMSSATGAIVTGWLASQTDMLAEDWGIYCNKEN